MADSADGLGRGLVVYLRGDFFEVYERGLEHMAPIARVAKGGTVDGTPTWRHVMAAIEQQGGPEAQSSTPVDDSTVYHADGTPCGPRGVAAHGPREPGRERELTPICYAHELELFDRFAGERERFEARRRRL